MKVFSHGPGGCPPLPRPARRACRREISAEAAASTWKLMMPSTCWPASSGLCERPPASSCESQNTNSAPEASTCSRMLSETSSRMARSRRARCNRSSDRCLASSHAVVLRHRRGHPLHRRRRHRVVHPASSAVARAAAAAEASPPSSAGRTRLGIVPSSRRNTGAELFLEALSRWVECKPTPARIVKARRPNRDRIGKDSSSRSERRILVLPVQRQEGTRWNGSASPSTSTRVPKTSTRSGTTRSGPRWSRPSSRRV